MDLNEENILDSMTVMQEYGNMSSATILFILSRIIKKIKSKKYDGSKSTFVCAFGPGLTIEMLSISAEYENTAYTIKKQIHRHAVQA